MTSEDRASPHAGLENQTQLFEARTMQRPQRLGPGLLSLLTCHLLLPRRGLRVEGWGGGAEGVSALGSPASISSLSLALVPSFLPSYQGSQPLITGNSYLKTREVGLSDC